MQKVDFWLLLGVFSCFVTKIAKMLQKAVKKGNAINVEISTFVTRLSQQKQKKWLYRGMLYRNYN